MDWITDPATDPPIAAGYPDGTFRPNDSITRGQLTRRTEAQRPGG